MYFCAKLHQTSKNLTKFDEVYNDLLNIMNWKLIETENDFDMAIEKSNSTTVIVFKHSTRCPVSSMAKRQLERDWTHSEEKVETYFLDLIRYRDISNYIAIKSQVIHQSPQMIVFKNKEVIHHASHHEINANSIAT